MTFTIIIVSFVHKNGDKTENLDYK